MVVTLLYLLTSYFTYLYASNKLSLHLSATGIFFTVFIIVLRTENIPDYVQYEKLYSSMRLTDFAYSYFKVGGVSGRETLFATVMTLFNSFLPFNSFYALIAASLYVGFFYLCKSLVTRTNVYPAYIVFSALFSINYFIISIRNGVIVLLFFLSVKLFNERRYFRAIISAFIAHTVHFMGLLLPVFLLLYSLIKHKRYRIISIVVIIILIFFLKDILKLWTGLFGYSGYLLKTDIQGNNSVYILYLLISSLTFLLINKKYIYTEFSPFYLFGTIALLFFVIPGLGLVISRFLPVIGGLSIIAFSVLIYNLMEKNKWSDIAFFIVSAIVYSAINSDRGFTWSI